MPPSELLQRIRHNALLHRLLHGTLWSILSSGTGQGASLLASMATARLLGAEDFGKLGILISTVNLFVSLGAAGLGITATRYVAAHRNSDRNFAGRILGLSAVTAATTGVLAAVLLLLTAPWIAVTILAEPSLTAEVRLSACILLFSAYNGYQAGALSGFEAFRGLATANLMRGLAAFPILVFAAWMWGLPGAVLGNGLSAAVNCLAHSCILRQACRRSQVRISLRFHLQDLKLLYQFSMPVVISGISWSAAGWAGNALLARSAGFRENGLFQVGVHWLTLGLFLSNAIGSVGLPMLSNTLQSGRRYLQILTGNAAMMVGANLLIALPAILFSSRIASVYGPQYLAAAPVIRIMCLNSILFAMNLAIQQIIWSQARAVAGLLFSLLRALSLVLFAYLFVHRGASGLATAFLLTTCVVNLAQFPFAIHILRGLYHSSRHDCTSRMPEEVTLHG